MHAWVSGKISIEAGRSAVAPTMHCDKLGVQLSGCRAGLHLADLVSGVLRLLLKSS